MQLHDTQKRRAIFLTWLAVTGISILTRLFEQKELAELLLYILGLCFAVHVHLLGDAQPPRLSSRLLCVLAALLMCFGMYYGTALSALTLKRRLILLLPLFLFFYSLFSALCRFPWQRYAPCRAETRRAKPAAFLLLALFLLAILLVLYLPRFPYGQSPDTRNQWAQIHGELRYNTIHAIGHTIFLKALLSIWDNYTFVILVHILGLTGLYLLFAVYFCGRGMDIRAVALIEGVSLLWTSRVAYAVFFPWKDLPACLCLGLLSYFFLRLQDKGALRLGEAFGLGLSLAWTALFRLNGIIAAVICGLLFAGALLRRAQLRQLLAMALAILLSVSGVWLYTSLVLKPARYENGFSIQVFGSGIAAAVANDELTAEEEARIDALLSTDWMRSHYPSSRDKRVLIWGHEESEHVQDDPELAMFNNRFVLSMGAHKKEVILLYLSLLPRHFPTMLKDAVGSVRLVWGLDSFFFPSSHIFPALLLLILLARIRPRPRDLLFFLPCLCNTVSIMISTITNELRYLLPSYLLFPFFFCFLLCKAGRDTERAAQ